MWNLGNRKSFLLARSRRADRSGRGCRGGLRKSSIEAIGCADACRPNAASARLRVGPDHICSAGSGRV